MHTIMRFTSILTQKASILNIETIVFENKVVSLQNRIQQRGTPVQI